MGNPTLPSNRQFGIVIGTALFLIGWFVVNLPGHLIAIPSATFVVLGLFNSQLLNPFNKAWMRLGFLLAKVMNPLILGILYFLLLTPVAICLRLMGRDELSLINKNESKETYFLSFKNSEKNFNFDDQF